MENFVCLGKVLYFMIIIDFQVEVSSRENGSSGDGVLDDIDGDGVLGIEVFDFQRTKSVIEYYQRKFSKIMELIKVEQVVKEGNWSKSCLK